MDKNSEVRDGFVVSSLMKQIWGIQLELLSELLRVCDKHNLQIWADSGTLLGAVRHHGYIPWDDDIDMIMMRDDYEKLIKLAPTEFKSPYFLQSAWSEKTPYTRGHIQLRKDGTAAILPSETRMRFHQGVFIDIFEYDAVPDDDSKLDALIESIRETREKVCYWNRDIVIPLKPKTIVKTIIAFLHRQTHNYIDDYCAYNAAMSQFSIKDNAFMTRYCLWYNKNYIVSKKMDKHLYDETIRLPFEDTYIPVPKEYDTVLRIWFGPNYMTPIQQPTYHGGFAVLDPNKSYTEYMDKVNKEQKRAIWANRIAGLKKALKIAR